ncbi:MAG: septum formation protein Maf [Spirochaetes bacterium]|nr:septum formation protein Maf [Spirochaetota bacterium]
MNIILGSTSPRRKKILCGLVDSFSVVPPSADETYLPPESPEAFAARVSGKKCMSIVDSGAAGNRPTLVITSDTIVTIDGRVIGKPADFEDAVRMISFLNGRTHRVITALTLLALDEGGSGVPLTRCETTEVTFRKLSRDGITRYLGAIDYRDKAGSYAFQERGEMIIEGHRGSATNIIGFPLRLFFSMTAEMGITARIFNLS